MARLSEKRTGPIRANDSVGKGTHRKLGGALIAITIHTKREVNWNH